MEDHQAAREGRSLWLRRLMKLVGCSGRDILVEISYWQRSPQYLSSSCSYPSMKLVDPNLLNMKFCSDNVHTRIRHCLKRLAFIDGVTPGSTRLNDRA